MNNTKWNELTNAIMEQMRNIPIRYKTLFDVEGPKMYWTIPADEHFDHMYMSQIEWFKIGSEVQKVEFRGRLIDDKISTEDKRQEIEEIMLKYNIPYEYDEEEKCFTVYGYK